MAKLLVGMKVRAEGIRPAVEVLEGPNSKGEYLVLHGAVRLWLHEDRLEAVLAGKKRRTVKQKIVRTGTANTTGGDIRIDLHGLTTQEARDALDRALNDALLAGANRMEIIHGIGTGKVKQAVLTWLGASKHVKSFRGDDLNPGTTWAFL